MKKSVFEPEKVKTKVSSVVIIELNNLIVAS